MFPEFLSVPWRCSSSARAQLGTLEEKSSISSLSLSLSLSLAVEESRHPSSSADSTTGGVCLECSPRSFLLLLLLLLLLLNLHPPSAPSLPSAAAAAAAHPFAPSSFFPSLVPH